MPDTRGVAVRWTGPLVSGLVAVSIMVGPGDAVAAGELVPLAGKRGCLTAPAMFSGQVRARSCKRVRGLAESLRVTLSRDGRNAYLASERGVGVFSRDKRSGALRQLGGVFGCVSVIVRDGCGGLGLSGFDDAEVPHAIASPDDRHLYVSFEWGRGDDDYGGGIVGLARSAATGALTPLPGPGYCVRSGGGADCPGVVALNEASPLMLSPDGRHLYAPAWRNRALAVFERDPATGAITQAPGARGCLARDGAFGCTPVRRPFTATSVTLTPDGRHAYVAMTWNCRISVERCHPGGIAVLRRDVATGALDQLPGAAGCVRDEGRGGCTPGRGMWSAHAAAVAPDGRHVYVTSGDGIATFRRNPVSGALRQLRGRAGCLTARRSRLCAGLRGITHGAGIEIAPDGQHVYVGTGFQDGTVGVFRRRANGRLTQLPRRAGCVSRWRQRRCTFGRISKYPFAVRLSPDGRHAYVDGYGSLVIFRVRR